VLIRESLASDSGRVSWIGRRVWGWRPGRHWRM